MSGKYVFSLVGMLVLVLPVAACAQVPFVECADNPIGCTLDDLLNVPVRIYNFLLGIAGIVLLMVVVWAGIRMMLFHLSEMPESELAAAKMTLTRGIIGLLIVAGAYLIVNLVLFLLGFYHNSAVGQLLMEFGLK